MEPKRSLEFWKRLKEALSFSFEPQLLVGLGSLPAVAGWLVKVCPLLDGAGDQPWELGRTIVAQGDNFREAGKWKALDSYKNLYMNR